MATPDSNGIWLALAGDLDNPWRASQSIDVSLISLAPLGRSTDRPHCHYGPRSQPGEDLASLSKRYLT
jgi:hypothetical protein